MNAVLNEMYCQFIHVVPVFEPLPVGEDIILHINRLYDGDWCHEVERVERFFSGSLEHVEVTVWCYFQCGPRQAVASIRIDGDYASALDAAVKTAIEKAFAHYTAGHASAPDLEVPGPVGVTMLANVNCDIEEPHEEKTEEVPIVEPETKPAAGGYSQKQIDDMIAFRKKYEILDNDMLIRHVATYDPSVKTVSQLTPKVIDGFLAWIDALDKGQGVL